MLGRTIHDQLVLDGNSQHNLATFCTTWIEPEVEHLMDESADKNMIDKDEYPQTAAIEERCVHMLADLWNSPEAASTMGCSTTGSSEAAMLGGLALKWNWVEEIPKFLGPAETCVMLQYFARYLRSKRSVETLVGSTGRIFDLISAVKTYAYMDRAPILEVDVPAGLDATLQMLQSRVGDVEVIRNYASNLPTIAHTAAR